MLLLLSYKLHAPSGSWTLGRPLQRYRDKMKANMQSAGIDPRNWETLACNRSKWREVCHSGVQHYEENALLSR